MSDQSTTETPPADAAAAETTETPADEQPTGDVAALRREAAGYRTKLRETETERDQLRERVTAMQRAEVERIATTEDGNFRPLSEASDVWLDGTELASFLTDDGDVNADAVRAATASLIDKRPGLGVAQEGFDGGTRRTTGRESRGPSFSDLVKKAAGAR